VRFRVTSITDPDVGPRVAVVTAKIEDWLNASLSDGKFGEGLDQITFFVVSVWDEPSENERWAVPRDKLGRAKNHLTGESSRELSFGIPVAPSQFKTGELEQWLRVTAEALREEVSIRPKRISKGFEYEICASAISAALSPYVPV
jgi:hypothetical protein